MTPTSKSPASAQAKAQAKAITPAMPAVSRDLSLIHPIVRIAVGEVLKELETAHIPMRVFEAYRSPSRQAFLFAQGRTKPGTKVTNAKPWDSYHQFGLAVDFALFLDGKWTWDASGELVDAFTRLHDVGRFYGLEPISFEKPHLQLSAADLLTLKSGMFPSGGDKSWWDNLESNIKLWKGFPAAPPLSPAPIKPTPNPFADTQAQTDSQEETNADQKPAG